MARLLASKVSMNPYSIPRAKVDPGSLAEMIVELFSITNLRDGVVKQALFRGGMLASGMVSLWSSDGKGNGGDSINRSGDDSSDSGDGSGNGGVGAAVYSAKRASMDAGRAADSSVSNGFVSSDEGTGSGTGDAGSVEAEGSSSSSSLEG
ncbi:hypothetical protein Tco_1421942 [Tanacetum coccineum]